jgi:primosomal protein N' (replication factor Y) (superfamily II helicase)
MPDSPTIEDLFEAPARVVDVLLPLALDKAYSYRAPAGLSLSAGDLVTVPLGNRETIGVIWDRDPDAPAGSGSNLKAVIARHDWPPVSANLRRFVDWIASYTLAPKGMVARMAIRDPEAASAEKPRYGVRLTGNHPAKLTDARSRVILAAQGGFAFPKSDLARLAGVSTGVIDALVDAEVMEAVPLPPESVAPAPDPDHAVTDLNATQAEAAAALVAAVSDAKFAVSLLAGADPDAGNRTYSAVPRAFREALWRQAGRMAFRCGKQQEGPALARHCSGRCQSGGGRALRPVPAVLTPWPCDYR